MELKNNLYTIQTHNIGKNHACFSIMLNAGHYIYKLHFPNNPITPGACLIQIVVELFGIVKGEKFRIKILKNVKFITPVSPLEFLQIDVSLDFIENQIIAVIKKDETVFAKINMILIPNSSNFQSYSFGKK